MPLHPILIEKLNEAVSAEKPKPFTRRDAQLPAIPGKVHAIIGIRRAGKTTNNVSFYQGHIYDNPSSRKGHILHKPIALILYTNGFALTGVDTKHIVNKAVTGHLGERLAR